MHTALFTKGSRGGGPQRSTAQAEKHKATNASIEQYTDFPAWQL